MIDNKNIQIAPPLNPLLTLPEQLKVLREAAHVTLSALAQSTHLSRLTVAAAEGKTDARISTLSALFDQLGYTLVPVPKALLQETVAFVNNQGQVASLPAGVQAPLGRAQQAFQQALADAPEF
jgi:transcriptional regulator with XRE-family HTH domain